MTDPPAGDRRTPARKAPRATRAAKAPPKTPAKTPPETPAKPPARRPRAKPAPPPPPTVQAVVFSLAGDEYALPIAQVQEVIAYREPRVIASPVAWVRGVINLRGTILPVCDLAARLGRSTDAGQEARIVVVAGDDALAGLIVGDVREVLTIAREQLEDVRVTSDPAITAIAKLGERLVVLLDGAALLAGAGLGPGSRPA